MKKINKLKSKKLLKELDYMELDYTYKTELLSEIDGEFFNYMNTFLDKHTQLKELLDNKQKEKIEKVKSENEEVKDNTKEEKEDNIKEEEDIKEDKVNDEDWNVSDSDVSEKSPKLKKLYREIVKLTHPDRIKDSELNEIYILATDAYDEDDLPLIYKFCDDLGIDFEIDDEDDELISKKIDKYKQKVTHIESSFTWKWYSVKTVDEKDHIVLDYIKALLMSL